ncbi:MAG: DUF4398 domain-containing protein [Brevinematales bacterium]|nr:DUF4398 domain-containing protein [Brevinematales bacterium]
MKKIFIPLSMMLLFVFLSSCGEATPVKEIEDAKSAIERAKSVEAPSYAADPYNEAESSLKAANEFVEKKKNKEAKDKAIASKGKAELAYNTAITNRAMIFYNACSSLLNEAEKYFGQKLEPENYTQYKNDFQTMTAELESKSYDKVYESGKVLKPKLESFVARLKELYNDISLSITMTEERIENLKAENNAEANNFLSQAEGKIKEAKDALANGDYEIARQKVKEAEALCDKADDIINPKPVSEKSKTEKGTTPRKGETIKKEVSGDEAMEAIKRAKEKQEELKKRKKIIYYTPEKKYFTYDKPKLMTYTEQVEIKEEVVEAKEEVKEEVANEQTTENSISENTAIGEENTVVANEEPKEEVAGEESTNTEEEMAVEEETNLSVGDETASLQEEIRVKDEDITEEMINKYISIAEELYQKGEYNKSLLYANEAVRMADYLLEKDYSKFYRVKRGDCLWNIAKFFYKRPLLWPIIYKANKNKIKHPDLIYPNQVFEIPPKPKDVNIRQLYKEINYKPLVR